MTPNKGTKRTWAEEAGAQGRRFDHPGADAKTGTGRGVGHNTARHLLGRGARNALLEGEWTGQPAATTSIRARTSPNDQTCTALLRGSRTGAGRSAPRGCIISAVTSRRGDL